MDATDSPRRTEPPTIDELQRTGVLLYRIGSSERVYMLPDRSTWYCRRVQRRHGYRVAVWEIRNRDEMLDD